MRNFRELNVYKQSMHFCVEIYRICNKFPAHERFALANQMERAVVSISSNISEGSSRSSDIDFAHFLEISLGSAFEVETQLSIAYNLQYIDSNEYNDLISQLSTIQKGLGKFIGILKKQSI